MRTTRLAFNDLQNGFDVIAQENLRSIKGGVASTTWEYAIDPNGGVYWRVAGTEDWYAFNTLSEVEVVAHHSQSNWGNYITTNPFGGSSGAGDSGTNYGGGGSTGGGTTSSTSNNFNDFLSSLIGTTNTSVISQFNPLTSNSFVGQNGITTYTGVVTTISNPNAMIMLNTTVDNGTLSSFSLSLGNVGVTFLANVGYSFDFTVNGVTHSSGMSISSGMLFGTSITGSGTIAGYEVSHMPGWGDVALALCIVAALETGGGSLAAYAELAPLFAF